MAKNTPQQWQELAQQQKLSLLSVTAFCHAHNISTKSFYYHRAKATQAKTAVFSEVIVQQKITPPNRGYLTREEMGQA